MSCQSPAVHRWSWSLIDPRVELPPARSAALIGANWIVFTAALSLPWSTSASALLLTCGIALALLGLGYRRIFHQFTRAAGASTAFLWALAVLGMLWSEASWSDALSGLRPYHKLLAIPVFLALFAVSNASKLVVFGFFASCLVLMVVSWLQLAFPALIFDAARMPGVPVKDRIVQGVEFALCGMVLAVFVLDWLRARRLLLVALGLPVAMLFLINVTHVTATRTGGVLILSVFSLIGWKLWRARGLAALMLVGLVLVGGSLLISSPFRDRILGTSEEIAQYEAKNPLTSTGLRLDYWRQAFRLVLGAPLLGHGTGSVRLLSEKLTEGEPRSARVIIPGNPHNQVLAVGVQLGLFGMLLLCVMWLAHWQLFEGTGRWALAGSVLVAQNIVSSLFNSHLFDVTPSWIYIIGVSALATLAWPRDHLSGGSPPR
jgi:O-antigen ligase